MKCQRCDRDVPYVMCPQGHAMDAPCPSCAEKDAVIREHEAVERLLAERLVDALYKGTSVDDLIRCVREVIEEEAAEATRRARQVGKDKEV